MKKKLFSLQSPIKLEIGDFLYEICYLNISGSQLHQILENGVAKYGEGGG